MKHFAAIVPALLAILLGSVLLLQLLAWASLQDPRLEGADYYQAVLCKLFGPRTTWATLLGAGSLTLGLAGLLHAVLLVGRDAAERRQALPVFWAALGIGIGGLLGLLVLVNYFGLQSGEIRCLSEWFGH
jgi:hypothetical protein